jgi:hypothetical protein
MGEPRYFFAGDAEGEALAAELDVAAASFFFDFFFEPEASVAAFPPTLTDFASSVPSACFQYDPVTAVLAVMSAIAAAAPPFVTLVLSLTLKTRDSFWPAIVNVLALASTAETVPRNGIARGAFVAGAAVLVALADAAGAALALGEAVAVDFFVAAMAEASPPSAIATRQTAAMSEDFSFICSTGFRLETAAASP